MELMKDCQNCGFREYMAKVYDIHIDDYDCWLEKCLLEESEDN